MTEPNQAALRWRKKPVVIEAWRWDETRTTLIALECVGMRWAGYDSHRDRYEEVRNLRISTLEGAMRADPGDWIIKGVKGEFYLCKPDIFAATYEPADDRAAQEKPAPESAPARGYAALGTGQYAINHSRAGYPAELCISLASDEDKSGNRQVGESRDNPPDSEIRAEDMLIRIAFTSERGLFALEDQLAWVRRVHFPESAPAPEPVARYSASPDAVRDALRLFDYIYPRAEPSEDAARRALGES